MENRVYCGMSLHVADFLALLILNYMFVELNGALECVCKTVTRVAVVDLWTGLNQARN